MTYPTLIVADDHGFRRAIVTEDSDGPVVRYENRATPDGRWSHDRTTRPRLPFHAALDLAHQQVYHRPPTIHRGR